MRILIVAAMAAVVAGCSSGDNYYSMQNALSRAYATNAAVADSHQRYVASSRESARLSVEQYKQEPSTSNLMDAGDALGEYQAAKYR